MLAGAESLNLEIKFLENLSINLSINSGIGINKNYIFHNFKFHICLGSSGE